MVPTTTLPQHSNSSMLSQQNMMMSQQNMMMVQQNGMAGKTMH